MDLDFQKDLERGMIYTLEDENGVEQEFQLLGFIEFQDAVYCAFLPFHENVTDHLTDDDEAVILKCGELDGERTFETVDDEDEFDAVASLIEEELQDYFDEEGYDDYLSEDSSEERGE